MSLKVIRYRNYGNTMFSDQFDLSDFEQRFYWSFYELSNGSFIQVLFSENWRNTKMINEHDYCP